MWPPPTAHRVRSPPVAPRRGRASGCTAPCPRWRPRPSRGRCRSAHRATGRTPWRSGSGVADQARHHLLTGVRCLPDLRHVVPHVVGVDAARRSRRRTTGRGRGARRPRRTRDRHPSRGRRDRSPAPTHRSVPARRPATSGTTRHRRPSRRGSAHRTREATAARCRRCRGRSQFGDEQCPDRVDFGVAVDEDLRRHACDV